MKKKVLLVANEYTTILNFRMELIEKLVSYNFDVLLAVPSSKHDYRFQEIGCKTVDLFISRKSKNPLKDLKTLKNIKKIIKAIKPDVVLTFTIKPNVYGGMACKRLKVPYISNITGLGVALENPGIMQKITMFLYKKGLKKASMVFFQNEENMSFMEKHNIVVGNHSLIPGSGVNLERFKYQKYPVGDFYEIAYISRLMKEKGIDQFLDAAKCLKEKYSNYSFHAYGLCEQGYDSIIKDYNEKGIVVYHGHSTNMPEIYKTCACVVLPTYYPEGMSNVLLESAATGRPIITTNRPGCREIIVDKVNGYLVEPRNSLDLIEKIEMFINLTNEEKEKMGKEGRKKVEKEFDRKIVVNKYLEAIDKILR